MQDEREQVKQQYLTFAEYEAEGRCRAYFDLAHWVAENSVLLAFIADFPPPKRQPNLVFAAIRQVYGLPQSAKELEHAIATHGAAIGRVVMSKSTQTNEPVRCGGLLLALSQIDHPDIALLEVGASASLCLIPDYYQYQFGDAPIVPQSATDKSLLIECGFTGPMPSVNREQNIIWQKGIDLNRIDLRDDAACDWLEMLVWPGQDALASAEDGDCRRAEA